MWQGRRYSRKLLYVHVPKCAGISVKKFLQQHYSRWRTFSVYQHGTEQCDRFRRLPASRRHAFDLIVGHNAHNLVDYCSPSTVLATIIRNPVDRIVSHYFYVREQPKHYLHKIVMRDRMTLRDYVNMQVSEELRNYMTCSFACATQEEAARDPDGTLERAWAILRDRYQVVGVVERLESAIEALRAATGMSMPWVNTRYNTTRARRSLDELTEVDRQAIIENNTLDLQLYRRVAALAPHEAVRE